MNHDEHHPDPPAGIPGPAGDQPDQRPPLVTHVYLNRGPSRKSC